VGDLMLDAEQIEYFGKKLVDLREELERQLIDHESSSATVDLDQPIGRLSRMDAMQQQAMAKANRTRAATRIQKIIAAQIAIERGEYGECRICGEEIGLKRLEIAPEAPLCIACQQSRE